MQPIQLTQDHKDKLLEMCKVLFSKYEFYDEKRVSKNYICWKNKNTNFEGIHWFEFCMTHLVEKILNPKKPSRNQKEIFCNFFWETNIHWYYQQNGSLPVTSFEAGAKHPIDYLYEEFKKLNNKKLKTKKDEKIN